MSLINSIEVCFADLLTTGELADFVLKACPLTGEVFTPILVSNQVYIYLSVCFVYVVSVDLIQGCAALVQVI